MSTNTIPNNPCNSNCCPKCEQPGYEPSTWCPSCGFYEAIGRCVEIDRDWESASQIEQAEAVAGDPTMLDGIRMMPGFVWGLLAWLGFLGACVVAFHLLTQVGSALRIVGVVAMVLCGAMAVTVAHLYSGIQVYKREEDFELGDIAIRPIRLWLSILDRLPRTFFQTAAALGGVWVLILAHFVVGVPYSQLQDMTAPPKKIKPPKISDYGEFAATEEVTVEEAMKALAIEEEGMLEDEEAETPLTLDQAIRELREQFAEDEELEEELTSEDGFVPIKLRAAIIGFRRDSNTGQIRALIVAVKSKGRWKVAGGITKGLSPEIVEELEAQVSSIRRKDPIVKTRFSAKWVEPVISCDIRAAYSESQDKFKSLQLVNLQ